MARGHQASAPSMLAGSISTASPLPAALPVPLGRIEILLALLRIWGPMDALGGREPIRRLKTPPASMLVGPLGAAPIQATRPYSIACDKARKACGTRAIAVIGRSRYLCLDWECTSRTSRD